MSLWKNQCFAPNLEANLPKAFLHHHQRPTRQVPQFFEMDIIDKKPNKKVSSNQVCIIGYKGTYLGFVPSFESSGSDCIYYCVEKILDACNAREALMRESFADIQSSCLKVYFVDADMKVVETKIYDLARISYCCSNHSNDGRIFSWIYRQEIDVGFQLECHAIRFSTDKKASLVAAKLYESFNKMYLEVETAISCSSSMLTKFKSKLTIQNEADKSPTTKRCSQSSVNSSPIRRSFKVTERESGSFADNKGFDNIDEHCVGIEFENDNVFVEDS